MPTCVVRQALYRDPELVKSLLDGARLPEAAERVALSLDHDVEGPFIVLTREGRFVTCLGAGMRVHDLPIVTRAKLDATSARAQRLKDELARIRQVTDDGSQFAQGLERAIWSCSHLDTISAAQQTSSLLQRGEAQCRAGVAAAALDFDWCVSAQGLRALWSVARMGKDGLHYLRHTLCKQSVLVSGIFAELALGAFAHASSKLRAEAIKAMATEGVHTSAASLLGPNDPQRALLARSIVAGLDSNPAEVDAYLLTQGRELVGRLYPQIYLSGLDLTRSVPDAVAFGALTNQPFSWFSADRPELLPLLFTMLPWLARASLGDLYLPRVWLDKLVPPTGLEHFERWFRAAPCVALGETLRRRTVVAPRKVGRNEACACGSGRKSKHCCARARSVA